MKCSQCGIEHPAEELELSFRRPEATARMKADERRERVQESDDLTIIDGERFFVRGILPLPVAGREDDYAIGLWVELPRASFERVHRLWKAEDQVDEPPFPVTLANEIPTLPSTLGLLATMTLTGPTTRPVFHLTAVEHPLHLEQTAGITSHRIHEYTALFL